MSYATMLVHVDADGGSDNRDRIAADLASRFNSHLIGAAAWMPKPAFAVEGVTIDPEPTDADLNEMRAALSKRADQFRATVGAGRKEVEWRSALTFPTEFITREARAADLIIIGADRTAYDPYRATDAGEVILRAGRPVLVVPPNIEKLAGKRVVVAWKDVREARRAIADALPFLHVAQEVFIVEACKTGQERDAQCRLKDVADYLARHQITKVTERVLPVEGTAPNALLQLVGETTADLIVAGAYGHSRLGEWIFGGMTQSLLTRSPICCLFSH